MMLKNQKNDFLIHYGVKGMRWGIRHDKPRNGKSVRKGLSDKQKKILKRVAIGAAIVGGVALTAYGAYSVSNIVGYKKVARAGKKAVDLVFEKRKNEAFEIAKKSYSHSVYDHFSNKQKLIKEEAEDLIKTAEVKRIEDYKRLVNEGKKLVKQRNKARIKDIIKPSMFGKSQDLYDPYKFIEIYKGAHL